MQKNPGGEKHGEIRTAVLEHEQRKKDPSRQHRMRPVATKLWRYEESARRTAQHVSHRRTADAPAPVAPVSLLKKTIVIEGLQRGREVQALSKARW